MAGEVQAMVAAGLGGELQSLRVMLSVAAEGFASGAVCVRGDGTGVVDVGAVGRWPASTGMDLAALQELETYISTEFLPSLRAGIQATVYTPNLRLNPTRGNRYA